MENEKINNEVGLLVMPLFCSGVEITSRGWGGGGGGLIPVIKIIFFILRNTIQLLIEVIYCILRNTIQLLIN